MCILVIMITLSRAINCIYCDLQITKCSDDFVVVTTLVHLIVPILMVHNACAFHRTRHIEQWLGLWELNNCFSHAIN